MKMKEQKLTLSQWMIQKINTKSYRALTRCRYNGTDAKKLRIRNGNFAIMVEIFIKRIEQSKCKLIYPENY